ncbi:unnamed protein product [Rangifer tarandus platyrhynchus]|uniref:Uncharacterized protein n=1 Tax=Rangifer tarandus platyrhynchus TaxID=3082113 RepID=A0ABN8XXZ6_RANTA|nr:unnamed protein product [Rangifer tarandus platyrhynchus]
MPPGLLPRETVRILNDPSPRPPRSPSRRLFPLVHAAVPVASFLEQSNTNSVEHPSGARCKECARPTPPSRRLPRGPTAPPPRRPGKWVALREGGRCLRSPRVTPGAGG